MFNVLATPLSFGAIEQKTDKRQNIQFEDDNGVTFCATAWCKYTDFFRPGRVYAILRMEGTCSRLVNDRWITIPRQLNIWYHCSVIDVTG